MVMMVGIMTVMMTVVMMSMMVMMMMMMMVNVSMFHLVLSLCSQLVLHSLYQVLHLKEKRIGKYSIFSLIEIADFEERKNFFKMQIHIHLLSPLLILLGLQLLLQLDQLPRLDLIDKLVTLLEQPVIEFSTQWVKPE